MNKLILFMMLVMGACTQLRPEEGAVAASMNEYGETSEPQTVKEAEAKQLNNQ